MITPSGWLDWATHVPGPADKTYSQPNSALGYVPHSAVGYYGGWSARLFSRERDAQGRYTPYAAASIHGWIAYDGSVIQHYPFTASCWGSGSAYPNCNFVAFENEGGHLPLNEPLTPAQIDANVRIIKDLGAWKGYARSYWQRPASEADLGATLYEHNECVRFGSAATACPSGRINWLRILNALDEEDDLSQEERDELGRLRINDALFRARERVFRAVYWGDALFRPKESGAIGYLRITSSAPIIEPEEEIA